MDVVRTPEERFKNLPDYPIAANYVNVDDRQGGSLHMHYVDEGAGEVYCACTASRAGHICIAR